MRSPEAEAIRQSYKGQLKYDSCWHLDDIRKTLEECTRPPAVKKYTKNATYQRKSDHQAIPQRSVKIDRHSNIVISVPCTPEPPLINDNIVASTPVVKNGHSESDIVKESLSMINKETGRKHVKKKDRPTQRRVEVDYSHTSALLAVERRLEMVRKTSVEKKKREFEDAFRKAQTEAQLYWEELCEDQCREEERRQQQFDADIAEREAQTKQYLHHKAELDTHRKKMQDAQFQEAQLQIQLMEQKRRDEIQLRINLMKTKLEEAQKRKTLTEDLLKSCQFIQMLPETTKKAGDLIQDIIKKIESRITDKNDTPEKATANAFIIEKLAKEAKNIGDVVQKAVEVVTARGMEELKKKEEQEKAKSEAEQAKKAAEKAANEALRTPVQVSDANTANVGEINPNLVCDPVAFQEYQRLQQNLKDTVTSYQSLVTDAQFKKYRFDLQKAVSTPVNAISPNSGAHLRDKLQRLCKLLSGQAVEVGGQSVKASDHPAGIVFCKHLFAKKIVKQGDDQVSSNHESAFAIAAVTVGVLTQFPDIKDLLLAEFYLKCPFLVPYYIQKEEGQSMDDYLKTLGYNFDDAGTVEQQDKYLRRMTGIMRLFAAIMVSIPPQGPDHPHPLGMDCAWGWLTRLLNLKPQPDITATMLHDFLQVTGSTFIKTYKKQFVKMLKSVKDQFLPLVHAVTKPGSGGPVTRLLTYMETCISSGTAPTPEGMLPSNFWYT